MCWAEDRYPTFLAVRQKKKTYSNLCFAFRRHINIIHGPSSLSMISSTVHSQVLKWRRNYPHGAFFPPPKTRKTYSAYRCLLPKSSTKRVSPRVHISTATSPSHMASKRYRTFQRQHQRATRSSTCWVLLSKFSIQNKGCSSVLLTHVRCLLSFELVLMSDPCDVVLFWKVYIYRPYVWHCGSEFQLPLAIILQNRKEFAHDPWPCRRFDSKIPIPPPHTSTFDTG